jgi:hypothetical protein
VTDYGLLLAQLHEEQARISCDRNHRYREGGQYRPGVTTVIKQMDAPKLDEWKVRVQVEGTARAAHANPPRFGEDMELYVSRLVEIARDEFEHQRIADAAADLGSQVHKLVEHAIKTALGEPVAEPEVTDDAAFVFAGWREWAKGAGFSPLCCEARVVNRQVDYCGTLDAMAVVEGRLTVVDWKPKDVIYPERRLQLTAYAKAMESMGWPAMDRAVVALPRDGGSIRLVRLDDDPEETFRAFQACLTLYRWNAALRRGARKAAA